MTDQGVSRGFPTADGDRAAHRVRLTDERERIQVAVRKAGGRTYIDVRVWSRSGSQFFPTGRGLELKPDLLASLAEAASEALRDAIAEGLVAPPVKVRRRG